MNAVIIANTNRSSALFRFTPRLVGGRSQIFSSSPSFPATFLNGTAVRNGRSCCAAAFFSGCDRSRVINGTTRKGKIPKHRQQEQVSMIENANRIGIRWRSEFHNGRIKKTPRSSTSNNKNDKQQQQQRALFSSSSSTSTNLHSFANLDYDRASRTGFPEAVYAEGKTANQVATILDDMAGHANRRMLEEERNSTRKTTTVEQSSSSNGGEHRENGHRPNHYHGAILATR